MPPPCLGSPWQCWGEQGPQPRRAAGDHGLRDPSLPRPGGGAEKLLPHVAPQASTQAYLWCRQGRSCRPPSSKLTFIFSRPKGFDSDILQGRNLAAVREKKQPGRSALPAPPMRSGHSSRGTTLTVPTGSHGNHPRFVVKPSKGHRVLRAEAEPASALQGPAVSTWLCLRQTSGRERSIPSSNTHSASARWGQTVS